MRLTQVACELATLYNIIVRIHLGNRLNVATFGFLLLYFSVVVACRILCWKEETSTSRSG